MQCKIFNRPDGGSVQRNVWTETETSTEHTAGYGEVRGERHGEVGEAGGETNDGSSDWYGNDVDG